MSLGLRTIRTRGRVEQSVLPIDSRELVDDDIAALNEKEAGITAAPLKRLSARHHAIAQELADGQAPSKVAALYGMTASHISILKADATFRDLLSFYEDKKASMFEVVHKRMAGLALDAIDELSDRIVNTPEEVETGELTRLVQISADRTGHAPKRVEEKNVNINFGERLDAARNRVREQVSSPDIIDITPEQD